MEENKGEKKKGNITRWWLQLQFAFFQDKRVRALRRRYGDLSLIIYQKIMLKSLESNCRMRFEGLEDTFEEEIAVDIVEDESEKIPLIKKIVEFLIKHDLMIEEEDGEYYFPQAAKMCASETDSAERMRRKRARDREKEASQCYGALSPNDNNSDDTTSQSEVIRKDKNKVREEKEIENTLFTSLTFKEGETLPPSADAGGASTFTFSDCEECAKKGKVNLSESGIRDFYERMEMDGWKIKGSPVENLLLAMRGFAKNHKQHQKQTDREKPQEKIVPKKVFKSFKPWLKYHGYDSNYETGTGDYDAEITIDTEMVQIVWGFGDPAESMQCINERLIDAGYSMSEIKESIILLFQKWSKEKKVNKNNKDTE